MRREDLSIGQDVLVYPQNFGTKYGPAEPLPGKVVKIAIKYVTIEHPGYGGRTDSTEFAIAGQWERGCSGTNTRYYARFDTPEAAAARKREEDARKRIADLGIRFDWQYQPKLEPDGWVELAAAFDVILGGRRNFGATAPAAWVTVEDTPEGRTEAGIKFFRYSVQGGWSETPTDGDLRQLAERILEQGFGRGE